MVNLEMKSWRVEGQEKVASEEARLKREGFTEVSPTTKLSHKEYRVIEVGVGTFDVVSAVDTKADEEEEGSAEG